MRSFARLFRCLACWVLDWVSLPLRHDPEVPNVAQNMHAPVLYRNEMESPSMITTRLHSRDWRIIQLKFHESILIYAPISSRF